MSTWFFLIVYFESENRFEKEVSFLEETTRKMQRTKVKNKGKLDTVVYNNNSRQLTDKQIALLSLVSTLRYLRKIFRLWNMLTWLRFYASVWKKLEMQSW